MKMRTVLSLLAIFSFYIYYSVGAPGDPYGMINSVQTECEYQALTIGSRLCDALNSYEESVSFYRRFDHEYLQKVQSFHRILMIEMERRHLTNFVQENNLKVKVDFFLQFYFLANVRLLNYRKKKRFINIITIITTIRILPVVLILFIVYLTNKFISSEILLFSRFSRLFFCLCTVRTSVFLAF
jgi:hypothetical protein